VVSDNRFVCYHESVVGYKIRIADTLLALLSGSFYFSNFIFYFMECNVMVAYCDYVVLK
jgi:hypothetical protein